VPLQTKRSIRPVHSSSFRCRYVRSSSSTTSNLRAVMAGSRDVHGNMYSAFVNGRSTPATTFFSSTFTSGFVGLYDHDVFGVG
jgi:hypothetical protein